MENANPLSLFTQFLKWSILIGAGCFLFIFLLLLRNTMLPRYPYELSLDQIGLPGEEMTFQSRDGLILSGTLISAGEDAPLVILCHGVGANRYDLIETARVLYEKGSLSVFLFDFRAHGRSRGWITSFGHREQRDLLGVLDYLDSRDDLSHHYGLYGVSMGASVGILVAAKDSRIRAVCVDSPFVDLEETIAMHLGLLYPLPKFPFLPLAKLSYNLLFWTDVREVSPLKVVHKLSPRPFYVINDGEDDRMTPEQAKALYEKASLPKTLWIVPGAGHLEGRAVAEAQYDQSMVAFFLDALQKGSS